MTQSTSNVAALRLPHIAPLRNVLLMRSMMEHLVNRHPNHPGVGVLYGPAGVGKSNACAAVRTSFRAVYVELRDHTTKKNLFLEILHEMAIKPERTTGELFDQVCEALLRSRSPLILDMGDYLIKRRLVDTVLDLYEGSGAAIAIVGEELFAKNLKRASERVYDRVLEWVPAQPCDMDDALKLAKLYSTDVEIKEDLLAEIVRVSVGVARKIVVNIENKRQQAKKAGKRTIGLDDVDPKDLYDGEPPARRAA